MLRSTVSKVNVEILSRPKASVSATTNNLTLPFGEVAVYSPHALAYYIFYAYSFFNFLPENPHKISHQIRNP